MRICKTQRKVRRAHRTRAKFYINKRYPRLSVFRSTKHIYAQIIDDNKKSTLVSASDSALKNIKGGASIEPKGLSSKRSKAFQVGVLLAQKALKKDIKKIVFDRGSYKYHGRTKALADGARAGGLMF